MQYLVYITKMYLLYKVKKIVLKLNYAAYI